MPMSFPNMESLKNAAEVHKFRQPFEGETERDYRTLLADHVEKIDKIESGEIRYGVGWDEWTDAQKRDHLIRVMKV
jgi:hypothetical protein